MELDYLQLRPKLKLFVEQSSNVPLDQWSIILFT